MVIKETIIGLIANIGFDAVKEQYRIKQDEKKAHEALMAYLARQQKYNFNCSLEEEIDFEGLSEYIRGNLIDDVKKRLFGTKEERGVARQSISDKAAYYAKSNGRLSTQRARHLAVTAVDILRNFYRDKVGRGLLLVAAEIEDTIITEMTVQHNELVDKIDALEKKVENGGLLSVDKAITLMNAGKVDAVEKDLATYFAALSSTHDLNPYYGFAMEGTKLLKSIPLCPDAVKQYPPRFEVTATAFKMGGMPVGGIDSNTFSHAYRSQLPIEFDVITAKKYLGDVLDPIQNEAEEMCGAHVVMRPPAFPESFPCSVIIDGDTVLDYLLLRTKKIEEDGTAVLTNEEQENFNFKIMLMVNVEKTNLDLKVTPVDPSNMELLYYKRFLKKAISANNISLKSLRHNSIIISSKANLRQSDEGTLDAEIEFLERVVAIEEYFQTKLSIPEEITTDDHRTIDRLYSMISAGEYCGTCSRIALSFELSPDGRKAINELGDRMGAFAYNANVEVNLFNQKLCFQVLRKIEGLRFENFEKLKVKLDVLDDGDILNVAFISGMEDSDARYSEMFYSEDIEKRLFQSQNT